MIKHAERVVTVAVLGALLVMSGCAAVQTSEVRAPVQQRDRISQEAPVQDVDEAESSVIITPIPDSGSARIQELPSTDLPAPQAETRLPPSSSAVIALLDNADRQTRSGELDTAAAGLERALRLEPRNPQIWQRLAEIRLQQGQLSQAENLAAKSTSLSGNNADLISRNWEIIADARRRQGNVAGSREAAELARITGQR